MSSEREVRQALPAQIPGYTIDGELVTFHSRRATPGKAYLEPKDVLVRVYNATIANDGGFSGEVVALGDHIDSFGVNDYVFGGGLCCLQQYIVVQAEEIATKPRDLCFADASRIYAGTGLYEALQHLQEEMMVLILGEMTGFAAQVCREKGCFVTSTEDLGCGEQNIIEGNDILQWLERHTFSFDVVIDATGDLDLYYQCHKFTHKRAEYICVNPRSSVEAKVSAILPRFLGGGSRKFKVVQALKGPKKAAVLSTMAQKILSEKFEVVQPRIISFESVKQINPLKRYVTAVNILQQKDITPDDPDFNRKEGRASARDIKQKGKIPMNRRRTNMHHTPPVSRSPLRQSSTEETNPTTARSTQSATTAPYSPRRPSGLSHSISASNLSDVLGSPLLLASSFSPPQRAYTTQPMEGSPTPPMSNRKISMVRSPPALRRHKSSGDPSGFEDIELQHVMRSPVMSEHGDWETDDENAPLYTKKPTSPHQILSMHQPVSPKSDIDKDEAQRKKDELQSAKDQIEALQRQVESLMASQSQTKVEV